MCSFVSCYHDLMNEQLYIVLRLIWNIRLGLSLVGIGCCVGAAGAMNEPCMEKYLTADDAMGAHVIGDVVYIAVGGAGLEIVDMSNPAAPVLLGMYGTTNGTMDVHVEGGIAYLADGLNGLRCLDVSDPAQPVLLGTYDTAYFAQQVIVRDGIAYVADGFLSGLQVIDVSDPSAPALLGTHDTVGVARSMRLVGGLVYIADGHGGLHIIDVSDPASPVLVTTIENLGGAWTDCVEVWDGYAYVFESGGVGIKVFDVVDPAAPVMVGLYDMPSGAYANDMVHDGQHLFLAGDFPGRITRLRVLSPSNLSHSFDFEMRGDPQQIDLIGGRLFVSVTDYGTADLDPGEWDGESGLVALDHMYVCQSCEGDMTGDGSLDFFDIAEFLYAFGSRDPAADFTGDGAFDFFDVSAFLTAFTAGCP